MKIKAVSEYERVYASNEFEIPAMQIEQDGTCSMIYDTTHGMSEEIFNRIVIVVQFWFYGVHCCYDGPTLSLRNFRKCVNQNKELIKRILEGWGHPYVDFRGNYVCDLTDDAKLALNELSYRVNHYYNGLSPVYTF